MVPVDKINSLQIRRDLYRIFNEKFSKLCERNREALGNQGKRDPIIWHLAARLSSKDSDGRPIAEQLADKLIEDLEHKCKHRNYFIVRNIYSRTDFGWEFNDVSATVNMSAVGALVVTKEMV